MYNFRKMKKMKSEIKFESNISKESVDFLDVTVKILGNTMKTLYSKPTDAHLYLNSKSSHPHYVVKNITKGQFIRGRGICSDVGDYDLLVKMMRRGELLLGKSESPSKDPHTVLVCT